MIGVSHSAQSQVSYLVLVSRWRNLARKHTTMLGISQQQIQVMRTNGELVGHQEKGMVRPGVSELTGHEWRTIEYGMN